jgi:hypothetical protein
MYGIGYSYSGSGRAVGTNPAGAPIDNWGCYGADNGTLKWFLSTTTGAGYFTGRLQATSFYDYNDTGYYLDPNGTSQLSYVLANNWFRAQGNTGFYFQDYGYGLWAPQAASNNYGNVATYGTGRGGWSGYGIGSRHVIMSTGGDNIGIHDNIQSWVYYWDGSSHTFYRGYTTMAGSARAPIFYDSDNTGYYTDPNGTSNLNVVTATNLPGQGQTWQDVTSSRAGNTTYTNSTSRPITVIITCTYGQSNMTAYVGSTSFFVTGPYANGAILSVTLFVPPGVTYKADNRGAWLELR